MTNQPSNEQSVRAVDDSEARAHSISRSLVEDLDTFSRQYALHDQMSRAGEGVGQSERRFRDMLDALPAAIYTTDADGRLTHFNPAAVALSGRTPELGTDRWCVSWKLYHADGTPMPHDQCPMAIALKEGRAVHGERAILERPDGTRIWFMPYPTPIRDAEGQVVGGINMLVDITERMATEARIQSEADALTKLNELSSRLWNAESLREGLDEMLAATIDLLGADFGNIQMLDAQRNVLLIEAQRGFQNEFLNFFREVSAEDTSCCGRALHSGERIIVENVETDPAFNSMLSVVRNAGFRAVQSTPLIGRYGRPLGMISTHFRAVHRPSVLDLHLLDLYARQCADFIERCKSDEALRAGEERYRQTLSLMPAAVYACDAAGAISYFNERAAQLWGRAPRIGDGGERFCGSDQLILPDGTPMSHDQCPMAIALREGRSFRDIEVNICRPDGTIVPALVNIDPIHDDTGQVVGAINAFHDMTALKQAEEGLRRWERIFQRAGWAVAVADDQDSSLKAVNPAFAAMHGYTVEELVGKPPALTFAPESLPDFPRLVQLVRDKGDHVYESMHIRKDGSEFPCLTHATAIKDLTGKVICSAATFQDLTSIRAAEQALRESEERFRMIADNMGQLAWTCDQLGDVTWYNRRWFDYTGLSFEEMKDWGWTKCHHPDHIERVVADIKRSRESGEFWEDTFPLRGEDGKYRWFLSRAYPIRDEQGKIVRWFGTNTDIDEQVRAEQSLREADRRKDEFLAMLSHELRNPLAAISNAVQVLLRSDADVATVGSASQILDRQVGHMVRQVDDLLDVSRISHGKIDLRKERTELGLVVHQAVEAARPLCEKLHHELVVTLPPDPVYVHGDPARLVQVIGNLLNNACKFTDRGGRIRLCVEQDDEQVVVRVRDTGIGIPDHELRRIFEVFAQVDTSLARARDGLGLGLALVRKLVEMHQGSIEAHSEGVGRGSEFIFLRPPVLSGAPSIRPPEPDAGKPLPVACRRILVVDDNRDSAGALAMLLKLMGHEVGTAHDGLEAVSRAVTFCADVILLDIGMPCLNGYEAARRIREQPGGKDIVLVAVTGWGQEEDRRKSEEAGFDGHLVKPVDYAALKKLLDNLQAKTV